MRQVIKKIWTPQRSQSLFLGCPVWEVLLHGNRGGGKTDVLLMDYLQHVGAGFREDWRGILFREAYTELKDIIAKTRKWIPRIYPGAKFNKSDYIWTFEEGEELLLRYIKAEEDYDAYHGHEYPWIGWEELTNWPFDILYMLMMSCNRSSNPMIPRKYRATCNPSGPGHSWVKERFISVTDPGKIFVDKFGQTRTHLVSRLSDNKSLLKSDPQYMNKLLSMTKDNPSKRKAWVLGSWDILIGGFFTDIWDSSIHIIPEFTPPKSWEIVRSFDWGSSKPWSIGYGLECNGDQPDNFPFYIPKGSVFVIDEIYGWNGEINTGDGATSSTIAGRTNLKDKELMREFGIDVQGGPADTNIWEVRDGKSISQTMNRLGCYWIKAYKGSGSRISGWSLIREMLGAAKRKDLESPHLYFWKRAKHHIRTLPLMQRDKKKPEDIDTNLEDHAMDDLRYLLSRKMVNLQQRKVGI